LEPLRTREKRIPVQSGVVGVTGINNAGLFGVPVAAIESSNVIKVWTPFGTTQDCLAILFGLQGKSPRWDVMRILQREKETLQTRVALIATVAIPFHRSEATKDVPVRVQNHNQSVRVPVAAIVKVR
jgi:hypothetical protein